MARVIDALVLANDQVGAHCWEITVEASDLVETSLPGHFVHLAYARQCTSWMRRPFSIYRTRPSDGSVSLLYLCRGTFTQGLSEVRPGERVSLVGPLGNSFASVLSPEGLHVLVAGGIGAPPMAFLSEYLGASGLADRTTVINGARTRDLLVARSSFEGSGALYIETTDDGSQGHRGLVTDVLAELLEARSGKLTVYACGPTPMLRAVASTCEPPAVPCHVSLETTMPCGVGVCMGCVVKRRDSSAPEGYVYARSCHEGPVFAASDLIWD